jgi:hypothetical protein
MPVKKVFFDNLKRNMAEHSSCADVQGKRSEPMNWGHFAAETEGRRHLFLKSCYN